ncbi:MAG: hypothetical protein NDF55_07295 [archaeon GB-1867-005]|nr:hypothetical protein [Candidatus Culexmicrobium cathedralense]
MTVGDKKIITKSDKVALQVLIPKELYDELIRIAIEEYGSVKGAVSNLVERAIRIYLGPKMHTQIRTNPPNKIRQIYDKVIERVKELLGIDFKPYHVPTKLFEQAIAMERGSDPRTISKWISTFKRFKLIKFVDQYGKVLELL